MEYAGYLFVHFTGEWKDGEQIYFSLSRDGLHWQDLNEGRPVLYSHIGEKGVRDPFLIRSPWDGDTGPGYFLIATDLRIEAGKGWEAAVTEGSRDIMVWESDDLLIWKGPRPVTVGIEGAGCVWAPEAIYDVQKDAILVFWASKVRLPGDSQARHRIYGSYTRDFVSFTEPFIYLERENDVIDTTILHTQEGYYRYSKDETEKKIRIDYSSSLEAESFREITSSVLSQLHGVEGPEIFRLNNRKEWCLIVDRFAAHQGYLPLVTTDLSSGEFRVLEEGEFHMGGTVKRHGGILNITEKEYQELQNMVWQ